MSQPKIYENTFTGCTSLSSLKIPSDVVEVEDNAFLSCSSLRTITIPSSTLSVGNNSFKDCTSLRSFTSDSNKLSYIGLSAFMNDKKLVNFSKLKFDPAVSKADQSLNIVCDYAFAKTGIKQADLTLKPSVGDTFWGEHCFASCDNLTDVKFMYSTLFSDYMFDSCKSLSNVDFTQAYNVNNYVGRYVFNNCSSLQSITCDCNQFSFLKGFFQGCTNLKTLEFNANYNAKFKYVQKYAFANCSNLEEITFPDSIADITQLEDGCLSGCKNLKKITFHGIDPDSIFPNDHSELCSSWEYGDTLTFGQIYKLRSYGEYRYNIPGSEVDKTIMALDSLYRIAKEKTCPIIFFTNAAWGSIKQKITITSSGGQQAGAITEAMTYENSLNIVDTATSKTCNAIIIYLEDYYGGLNGYRDWSGPEFEPGSTCYFYNPRYDYSTYYNQYEVGSPSDFNWARVDKMQARKKAYDAGDYTYDPYVYAVFLGFLRYDYAFGQVSLATGNYKFFNVQGRALLGSAGKYNPLSRDTQAKFASLFSTDFDEGFGSQWHQDASARHTLKLYDISPYIKESGFLRANHSFDVAFDTVDKSKVVKYVYNSRDVKPFVEKDEYESDKTTTSGFKTPKELVEQYGSIKGIYNAGKSMWYYNVKEAFNEAKALHKPILIIYSKTSCTPCQSYAKNVHEDLQFQEWISKQKFICCRLEASKPRAFDKELEFCDVILAPGMANYVKTDDLAVRSFNAFENIKAGDPDHYFAGWYYGTTFQNPSFVFCYFNENDEEVAYHGYSMHGLIDVFNSAIGVGNFVQMLKSLCLYHFDDNSLSNPQFVVDAGKEFVKSDYDILVSNPYFVHEGLISLNRWKKLKEFTVDAVMTQMKEVLASFTAESSKWPDMIGGCLWGDFDWVSLTFGQNIQETNNASEVNSILNAVTIEIGDKMYKLQVDPNEKQEGVSTPCGESTIFKYFFTEAN